MDGYDDDYYTRDHEPEVRLSYNRGINYERSNDEINPHNVLPSIGASYSPDYDDRSRYDYNDDDDFYNYDGDAKRRMNRNTRDNDKDDYGDDFDEIEEKKKLKALEEEEERLRRKQMEEEERRRKIAERIKTPSPTRRQNTSERDVEYTRTLSKIEALRARRHDVEKHRDRLVRQAKSLQQDYFHKRHDARDAWKKKYFEEKKKTQSKEELFSELREKLHECHRKEILQLEAAKEAAREAVKRGEIDRDIIEKANLKLHVTKLKNDIEELSTQLQNTKMRLTAEIKLRNQSDSELRTMKRDKVMSLNNFYGKDDSMPIPKTNEHHSPRREKQVRSRDQEPQSFKRDKNPSFSVRKDPPSYRPELEVNFDDDFYNVSRRSPPLPAVLVPTLPQPRPQPKHITDDLGCQHCGSKKKTKDEPNILKVRDESNDHEVKNQPDILKNSDRDDTLNDLHVTCPNCGHWGGKKKMKHWRPNHGQKHPWEEISCPECKGYRRHWLKRCRCGGHRRTEHRTSRKRYEHFEAEKNKSSSRSSSSSSSTSSSNSSSSSSSSDSDSDDSCSSDEKKKLKRGHKKRKHHKDRPRRHGNKSRDKKRDKSKKSGRDTQADKPEKENESYERKDPPPEDEFRLQEQEDRKSNKNEDSRIQEFELQPQPEQLQPKPIVRKIKAGSRSPKLVKKAGKVDPNNPRGRPYRPGDLDDAFRTFASRGDGKEATNADIVKWCTDAEILGKNMTTQHIDISFSKVKSKGSKTIARKDLPALIEHMAFKYKDDHRMDMQQAKRQISERLANAPFMLHSITNAMKAGAVERLTDTTKYTGMHKNRFDETGKGKGNEGLVNYEGYVTNYKMAGTYDQRH